MLGVDGKALYDKPEREFKDCFGEAGVQIWRELYESAYGYVHDFPSPILFVVRICY